VWWHRPVISALQRLRQKDFCVNAPPGLIPKNLIKIKKKKKKKKYIYIYIYMYVYISPFILFGTSKVSEQGPPHSSQPQAQHTIGVPCILPRKG
jgi:hypothetical protein